jgi:uncharacterized protein (DUF697 family)
VVLAAAFQVDTSTVIGTVFGAVAAGSSAAGLVAKRQRDLGQLYKGLYEGKTSEVSELRDRLTHLEAQVELYQSDFTAKLAEGITEAIVRAVERRMEGPR